MSGSLWDVCRRRVCICRGGVRRAGACSSGRTSTVRTRRCAPFRRARTCCCVLGVRSTTTSNCANRRRTTEATGRSVTEPGMSGGQALSPIAANGRSVLRGRSSLVRRLSSYKPSNPSSRTGRSHLARNSGWAHRRDHCHFRRPVCRSQVASTKCAVGLLAPGELEEARPGAAPLPGVRSNWSHRAKAIAPRAGRVACPHGTADAGFSCCCGADRSGVRIIRRRNDLAK